MALDVPNVCLFTVCSAEQGYRRVATNGPPPQGASKRNRPCSSFPTRIGLARECRRTMQILLRSREEFSEMWLLVPFIGVT